MARWDVTARRYIENRQFARDCRKGCCPAVDILSRARLPKVQNYGPNPYSLIKLKNSLIARFHSLLGGKKYPVRSGRELARKPLNSLYEFTSLPAPHSAAERNSLYFPG
jgi:hypothetical protein